MSRNGSSYPARLWRGFPRSPQATSGRFDFFQKNQSVFLLILAIFFYFILFLLIGPAKMIFGKNQGIKNFYFFKILDQEILKRAEGERTDGAAKLPEKLKEADLQIIKRPDGRAVFGVYHWQ